MQLFCPPCHAAFSNAQRCPRCGGLLLMPQEAAEAAAPASKGPPPLPRPTPLGRVVIGSVLALALYLGLRRLAMGLVLAVHSDPDGWWSSLDGLTAVCGAQVAAVIFGAMVAAAGRAGGLGYGAIVGGLCGGLFLAAELLAGAPAQSLVLYVQPLLLTLIGGVAGVFAARVWTAAPAIFMPLPAAALLSSSQFTLETTEPTARPTSWLKIIIGASVMVAALVVAEEARSKAQKYSGGLLHVTSVGQGQFLTWQLGMFGAILGGGLAAAGTGAGIRHGLIAGGLAGAGVIGVSISRGEALVPVEYWLSKLSLGGIAPTDPAAIVGALGGVLLLGLIGGWLGGALVLPLAPDHMRQQLSSATD
jgi:hypothetical protein